MKQKRSMILNGDADGLVAAYQLIRERGEYEIYTDRKTNVRLVDSIADVIEKDSEVVVLDFSSDTNRKGLQTLLDNGAKVEWIDHHNQIDGLENMVDRSLIDSSRDANTSTIVNEDLGNKYLEWAIAGAYGDNKDKKAKELAEQKSISPEHLGKLKQIGKILNYNGFSLGVGLNDVLDEMLKHDDPVSFTQSSVFRSISGQYQKDKSELEGVGPIYASDKVVIYELPDNPSSTAMFGEFANERQSEDPSKAYFVIAPSAEDHSKYSVSIRSSGDPLASDLAKVFGGGGRVDAGGASIDKQKNPGEYILTKLKGAGYNEN